MKCLCEKDCNSDIKNKNIIARLTIVPHYHESQHYQVVGATIFYFMPWAGNVYPSW